MLKNNMPPLSIYQFLIPAAHKELIKDYVKWLILLSYRGLNTKKATKNYFNNLYKAITCKSFSNKFLLGRLQKECIEKNLSLSLLIEPLNGFEWLSLNRYPLMFSTSSPILLQLISPLARMIAVLNNQRPTIYQPLSNIINIYLALYLISEKKINQLLKNTLLTIDEKAIKETLPLSHKETKQILTQINGILFRLKVSFYLGLCQVLITRNQKNKLKKINFLDYVNAFLYGLWYTLTTKSKKLKSDMRI